MKSSVPDPPPLIDLSSDEGIELVDHDIDNGHPPPEKRARIEVHTTTNSFSHQLAQIRREHARKYYENKEKENPETTLSSRLDNAPVEIAGAERTTVKNSPQRRPSFQMRQRIIDTPWAKAFDRFQAAQVRAILRKERDETRALGFVEVEHSNSFHSNSV